MKYKIDLSVIITVYNRKEFIIDALNSIITDKVNNVEVIIITNIEIDINLDRKNFIVKVIKTNLKSLSQKVKFAVQLCNSNIISFLEDDDIYINNKINTLISIFNKYPEVDFYHNNFNLFRTRQNIHSYNYVENNFLKLPSYKIRNSNRNIKVFLIKSNSGYNLSSIAVRKEVILDHLNLFDLFDNYGVDTLLFFIYLAYGNSLYIDKNILTSIRIHNNNTSGTINEFYNNYRQSNFDRKMMSEFGNVKGKPFKSSLILFIDFNAIIFKVKSGKYTRLELLILLFKYILMSFKLHTVPSLYVMISSISGFISYNTYKKILSLYHKT